MKLILLKKRASILYMMNAPILNPSVQLHVTARLPLLLPEDGCTIWVARLSCISFYIAESSLSRSRAKVSPEIIQSLIDPVKNPVRDQLYDAQIEYHEFLIKKCQLQARFKQDTNGGQRYKQAHIQKVVIADFVLFEGSSYVWNVVCWQEI